MTTPRRIVVTLIAVAACLLIAAIFLAPVFLNLDHYRPQIISYFEQSTGKKPRLFITGGDAGMITGTMRSHGEIVPDLVLQGLAVIAAQPR